MEKRREKAIDFFRGIAILNIIFIHTVFVSGWNYVPDWVRNFSLLFDVPVFFFLAGWATTYSQSYVKKIKGLIELYRKCAYFIVVYCIVIFFVDRELFQIVHIPNYFLFVVTSPGNIWSDLLGSFWYLAVFFPVVGIFSIFLISKFDPLVIILFCIGALSCIWFKFYSNILGLSVYIWFYGLIFTLGYISRNYVISVKGWCVWGGGWIILINLLMYFYKFNIWIGDLNSFKFTPSILYFFYSQLSLISMVCFKKHLPSNKITNVFFNMGQNSIWLYFGQMYALTLGIYIEPKLKIGLWPIKMLVMFAGTLLISLIVGHILKKGYELSMSIWEKLKKKWKCQVILCERNSNDE